ncbi:hypothetical protein MYP_2733 [Sporocytophaga myxococcoides]|uniref:Uncharacterized protein n=1 Tax=Sporocytophaga myxococcoides TaxID=153721 RepID=A0A098LGB7_9BACT|nr:hypothetical protein MYP_2733 [Sporocytophaga myxococcoides]
MIFLRRTYNDISHKLGRITLIADKNTMKEKILITFLIVLFSHPKSLPVFGKALSEIY